MFLKLLCRFRFCVFTPADFPPNPQNPIAFCYPAWYYGGNNTVGLFQIVTICYRPFLRHSDGAPLTAATEGNPFGQ